MITQVENIWLNDGTRDLQDKIHIITNYQSPTCKISKKNGAAKPSQR